MPGNSVGTSAAPRKSKWRRRLLYGSAAAILLFLSGYNLLLSSWFITTYVLPWVSGAAGVRIEAERVEFSLLSSSLGVSGLRVGPSGDELLKLGKLDVRFDLRRLVKGEIAVGPVHLKGGSASLAADASGRWNFPSSGGGAKPGSASNGKASSSTSESLQIDISSVLVEDFDFDLRMDGRNGRDGSIRVSTAGLRIEVDAIRNGGSPTLRASFPCAIRVGKAVDAETRNVELSADAELGANLLPKSASLSLAFKGLSGQAGGKTLDGQELALNLDCAGDGASLKVGRVELRQSKAGVDLTRAAMSGDIVFEPFDAAADVEVGPVSPEALDFLGALSGGFSFGDPAIQYKGKCRYSKDSVSASGNFKAGGIKMSKAGRAMPGGTLDAELSHDFTLDIKGRKAELRRLSVGVNGGSAPLLSVGLSAPAKLSWGGGGASPVDGEAMLSIKADSLPLPLILSLANTETAMASGGFLNMGLSARIGGGGSTMSISGSASVSASGLDAGPVKIADAKAEISIPADKPLSIKDFSQVVVPALLIGAKATGVDMETPFIKARGISVELSMPKDSPALAKSLSNITVPALLLRVRHAGATLFDAMASADTCLSPTMSAKCNLKVLTVYDGALNLLTPTAWGTQQVAALVAGIRPATLSLCSTEVEFDGAAKTIGATLGTLTLDGRDGLRLEVSTKKSLSISPRKPSQSWKTYLPSESSVSIKAFPLKSVRPFLPGGGPLSALDGVMDADFTANFSGAGEIAAARVESLNLSALAFAGSAKPLTARVSGDVVVGESLDIIFRDMRLSVADNPGSPLLIETAGSYSVESKSLKCSVRKLSAPSSVLAMAAPFTGVLPQAVAVLPEWTLELDSTLDLSYAAAGVSASPFKAALNFGKKGTLAMATREPFILPMPLNGPLKLGSPVGCSLSMRGVEPKAFSALFKESPLAVSSGSLDFSADFRLAESIAIEQLRSNLSATGLELSLRGKKLMPLSFGLNLEADLPAGFDSVRLRKCSLSLSDASAKALDIEAEGLVGLKSGAASLQVSVSKLNQNLFKILLPLAPGLSAVKKLECSGSLALAHDPSKQNTRLKTDLQFSGLQLLLPSQRRALGDFDGMLKADVAAAEDRRVTLSTVQIDLASGRSKLLNLDASGVVDFDPDASAGKLKITSQGADVSAILALLDDSGAKDSPPNRTGRASAPAPNTRGKTPGLPVMLAEFDLKNLAYGSDILVDLAGKVRTAPDSVTLSPLKASINGAPLTAYSKIVLSNKGVESMRLDCSLSRLNLNPFFKTFGNGEIKSGSGMLRSFTAELTASGPESDDILASLQGPVTAQFTGIQIPNPMLDNPYFKILLLPLEAMAHINDFVPQNFLKGNAKLNEASKASGDIFAGASSKNLQFKSADIAVAFGDASANIKKCLVIGDGAAIRQISMDGTIGLVDQTLALNSNSMITGLEIPLTIGGTIQNPKPDYAKLTLEFTTKNTVNFLDKIQKNMDSKDTEKIIRGGSQGIEQLGKSVLDGLFSLPRK